MHEQGVKAIWIGGLALALVVYLVGPDRFVWELQNFGDNFAAFVAGLGTISFDLLRAAAIGLFVVFIGLSVIAVQRGVAGRLLIVVVVGGFLALAGRPGFDRFSWDSSRKAWVAAFFLAALGSALMTRRLAWHRPPR